MSKKRKSSNVARVISPVRLAPKLTKPVGYGLQNHDTASHYEKIAALFEEASRIAGINGAEAAINYYQHWLRNNPDFPLAYAVLYNLAVQQSEASKLTDAEATMRQVLRKNPRFHQARFALGVILERQGKKQEAIDSWQVILQSIADSDEGPDRAQLIDALNNSGRLLEVMQRFSQAEEVLTRSLKLNPEQPKVIHHWVHLRQKQCKWPIYPEMPNLTRQAMIDATSALAMLDVTDDPEIQLAAAQRFVAERVDLDVPRLSNTNGYGHRRLRIGYLSSDFCQHPVSMLMVEMFELHDRSRFEIYSFEWSPEDGSDLRARVLRAMDQCFRIETLSDRQAAELIRRQEIDILFDLQGLTAGARPNILACKPAPVQISYLGFPGTSGMPFIDYMLCDCYLIPEDEASHYSEKPLYLPRVFQVSDRKRAIASTPTRADNSLPEGVFVFCAFNNNHKYTPELFAIWMNILHQVPESVLWLLASNESVESNLRSFVEQHGVAQERIIFAPKVYPAEYLARYRIADLFLDCFPFNGGTTANDALWMGVPVLTISGRCFASRMAGSLLQALGLTSLIATSFDEYQEKAVALARSGDELERIHQALKSAIESTAVFDTERLTLDIENELQRVYREAVCSESRDLSGVVFEVEEKPIKLLVHGWRAINHSFAVVNQNQMLTLRHNKKFEIYHRDAPYYMPHWNSKDLAAGFLQEDADWIASLKDLDEAEADVVYRIFSPLVAPGKKEKRTITFAVTELGLSWSSFADPAVDLRRFTENDNLIFTPSRWSRDRLIDFGFDEGRIRVVPHGYDPKFFSPISGAERRALRQILNIDDQTVVFLNIGIATWNKGIDTLLKSYARVFKKNRNVKLILKDSEALYGLSVKNLIEEVAAENPGLLSGEVLASIVLIPLNLSLAQLRSIYGVADFYVSPYRAEGFNLPVLEALACGTPVIVSSGGATDDFASGDLVEKIPTCFRKSALPNGIDGCWLDVYEPALDEIMLKATQRGPIFYKNLMRKEKLLIWENVVNSISAILRISGRDE